MGNRLDQLVPGDTVLQRLSEMEWRLVAAVEGNERRHRDEAPVALGKAGPRPHVAEQHIVRELDQLGRDVANRLLRCGWFLSHCYLLQPADVLLPAQNSCLVDLNKISLTSTSSG
jgi:hypothetical protein